MRVYCCIVEVDGVSRADVVMSMADCPAMQQFRLALSFGPYRLGLLVEDNEIFGGFEDKVFAELMTITHRML